ncbi:hypothetical protein BJ508DRAFT_312457 [Ascobolus immersus RN42]|uniref:FAS1 domain-containing protein n=1 Tax=Ascobolus immersus RN42 TaxID=1160509 RepID=A0A3N4HPJ5_ASCIM|nr:hypothetical protein BJ508DRAFT_312457 [Ascobolus immersus RN42]
MRFLPSIFGISILVASSTLISASQIDVLAILRLNDLTEYASSLEQNPELLQLINSRNDLKVFATRNNGLARRQTSTGPPSSEDRSSTEPPPRLSPTQAQMIQHFVKQPPNPPGRRPTRRDGSDGFEFPRSNYETLITYLEDPAYVNLGEKEPVRFISNHAGGKLGKGEIAALEITTGGGDVVRTLDGPFKFDRGVIYVIDKQFTLPKTLSQTFEAKQLANTFYGNIKEQGLLASYESTPAITLFAPVDTNFTTSYNPDDYLLNGLGYSNELLPGNDYKVKSGKTLKIDFGEDGSARAINGRNIQVANVPFINGILHFVDGDIWAKNETVGPKPPIQEGGAGGAGGGGGGAGGLLVGAVRGKIVMAVGGFVVVWLFF